MNAPLPTELAERAERQRAVVAAVSAVVPAHALLWRGEDTVPYECDGLTAYRETPLVVVLPETEAQVAPVLKTCHALAVPVVARGAGTGLSGGAMPNRLGVTLALAKFNRIVRIDKTSRSAVVQCGVRNLAISEAAAPLGLYYAPDPSSQIACTIGGNVAENAGGVHCLKYGLTLHNVLKVRGYTVEGEAIEFGGEALDAPGLVAAWASEQSEIIPGRDYLEARFQIFKRQFKGKKIAVPPEWGGYVLVPEHFEFWQGRENRLHDRICYKKVNKKWKIFRFAP